VRNTLLIIHFVAGSALTCIDCVNRWFCMGIRKFSFLLACLLVKEPFQLGNCCWKTPAKLIWQSLLGWRIGKMAEFLFYFIWGVHVQTISVFSLPPSLL
jgi:hypothetical protein